jgi:hypothetical protein
MLSHDIILSDMIHKLSPDSCRYGYFPLFLCVKFVPKICPHISNTPSTVGHRASKGWRPACMYMVQNHLAPDYVQCRALLNIFWSLKILPNNIVACRLVTGNDLETNNERTSTARQQILNKYMQPLLSNAFANKHIPTETIWVQQWVVTSTRSVPRCYKENN